MLEILVGYNLCFKKVIKRWYLPLPARALFQPQCILQVNHVYIVWCCMKKTISNIYVHFHNRRLLLTPFAICLCKITFMQREGFFFPDHAIYISFSFCFTWGTIRNKQIGKWKLNGSRCISVTVFLLHLIRAQHVWRKLLLS